MSFASIAICRHFLEISKPEKGLLLFGILSFFVFGTAKAQTPVIQPKNQVVLKLDNSGNRIILYTDVADIISGLTGNTVITVNPRNLDCSALGPQTIVITASNGPGNTAVQPVSVIVASTPVFSNYPDITIAADGNCKATLPDYTVNASVTDICADARLTLKQVPAAGTPLAINEPTVVTLTAGDQYGGTSATFFSVTSYSMPQIFPKPGPIILKLDANGNYTVETADLGVVFNCDGAELTVTINPQKLTCANLGPQTITLTASTIRPNPLAVTFSVPTDIALDAAGNIYVADGYSCSIRKIAVDGKVSTFAGGTCGYADGNGPAAMFNVVNGITIDRQGNLYVIDENDRIRKIAPDGSVTTLAGNGLNKSVDGIGTSASFLDPRGITIDAAGNLYITQGSDFLIRKVTPEGVVTTLTAPSPVSKLNTPTGITADALGNLYFIDYTSAVKKIAPDGTISIVAGHNGNGFNDGTGAAASFNLPKGITMDNQGNLYVTDSQNNAIRKISPSGVVTTLQLFTNNPNDKATLNNPIGIKMDAFGNLIVVDAANERIVRITLAGELSTIAGNGVVGNNNGNANTPPTLGSKTVLPIQVTVTSAINTTSPAEGITPVITSFPQNATVCAGEAVQFTAAIPSGNLVNSYQWQVNNVNKGTNSPIFSSTLNDGDLVTCTAANDISCTVPQSSLPITVHIIPAPEIIFNGNPTIAQGGSVVLSPQIRGDVRTLRWTPSTGLSSTTIANPTAYPLYTTTYYLTATSSLNCETTAAVTVNVITPIQVPNTFTPNGDGINDLWEIKDLLNFPFCTVDIFNRYGQALFHAKGYTKPWDGTFKGNRLPPGTYYYLINLQNKSKPLSGWVEILR